MACTNLLLPGSVAVTSSVSRLSKDTATYPLACTNSQLFGGRAALTSSGLRFRKPLKSSVPFVSKAVQDESNEVPSQARRCVKEEPWTWWDWWGIKLSQIFEIEERKVRCEWCGLFHGPAETTCERCGHQYGQRIPEQEEWPPTPYPYMRSTPSLSRLHRIVLGILEAIWLFADMVLNTICVELFKIWKKFVPSR